MVAQCDILDINGHCYSEIANESFTEDFLNPQPLQNNPRFLKEWIIKLITALQPLVLAEGNRHQDLFIF